MLDHNKSEPFTILLMVGIGSKFTSCTSISVGYEGHWTRNVITNIVPQVNENTVNLKNNQQIFQNKFENVKNLTSF